MDVVVAHRAVMLVHQAVCNVARISGRYCGIEREKWTSSDAEPLDVELHHRVDGSRRGRLVCSAARAKQDEERSERTASRSRHVITGARRTGVTSRRSKDPE